LQIDRQAALAAIPSMLPRDAGTRAEALSLIKEILRARGEMSAEDTRRLREIAQLFGLGEGSEKATPRPAASDK